MLSLYIEAPTLKELIQKAHEEMDIAIAATLAPAASTEPAVVVTRRGRPAKSNAAVNELVAAAEQASAEPAQPAVAVDNTGSGGAPTPKPDEGDQARDPVFPESLNPPTIDDVKAACMQITTKFGNVAGMAKCRPILQDVGGVKLVRDVPAEKRQAVIEALNAEFKK